MKDKHLITGLFVVSMSLLVLLCLSVFHKSLYVQEAERVISAQKAHIEQLENKLAATQADLEKAKKKVQEVQTTEHFLKQHKGPVVNWIMAHSSRISKSTAEQIVDTAIETGFFFDLLSIGQPESAFNPGAKSRRDARGVYQVLASDYQVRDLRDASIIESPRDLYEIESNTKAAKRLWRRKLKKSANDVVKGLKKYHGKPGPKYLWRILRNHWQLVSLVFNERNPPEPRQLQAQQVQVERGDTLCKLARAMYGQATSDVLTKIAQINNLQDIDYIETGQTLIFPKKI